MMTDKIKKDLDHILDEFNYLETIIAETIEDIDKELEKLENGKENHNADQSKQKRIKVRINNAK